MTLESFLERFAAPEQGLAAALALALLGGVVASGVCPCTLPVGLGVASVAGASESDGRRAGVGVAVAFFAGIVANLTLLGTIAGRLGALLTMSFGQYWTIAMAAMSAMAAVVALGGPRLKVRQLEHLRRPGLLGAFGYGFAFSLGTSVAPLLVLLTVAASRPDVLHSAALALAFGVGRGLPFLIVGLSAGAVVRFTRVGAWRRPLEIASAAALLLVSAYYARSFLDLI